MTGVGRTQKYSNHHRSDDAYLPNVCSTPELGHTPAVPRAVPRDGLQYNRNGPAGDGQGTHPVTIGLLIHPRHAPDQGNAS
jgi:hypothetical protein